MATTSPPTRRASVEGAAAGTPTISGVTGAPGRMRPGSISDGVRVYGDYRRDQAAAREELRCAREAKMTAQKRKIGCVVNSRKRGYTLQVAPRGWRKAVDREKTARGMMRGISPIGYCTNVHAGANWQTTRASLEQYAVGVKRIFRPEAPMGIGLWFSNQSSEQLERAGLDEFADWLSSQGLIPSTLNGFPFGDFHQAVVKHDVYLPDWTNPSRRQYTERLARLLDRLLPRGAEGSISTLPLAWGAEQSTAALSACAEQLAVLARYLANFESERGRLIYVCIEPEPGCALDTAEDVVGFFENHVFKSRGAEEAILRRHLRVCHDVCHSVVMFEEQAAAIHEYAGAGIEIGKVQVSSAVKMPLDELDMQQRRTAIAQLAAFHEPRYLHQTMVRRAGEETPRFYEDLHLALAAESENALSGGEWRVHFHVPIFVERFGALLASQHEILECLQALGESHAKHFEVETYAWGVLPKELQAANLSEGIAKEMAWLSPRLASEAMTETLTP